MVFFNITQIVSFERRMSYTPGMANFHFWGNYPFKVHLEHISSVKFDDTAQSWNHLSYMS